jgi:hypothetical protein
MLPVLGGFWGGALAATVADMKYNINKWADFLIVGILTTVGWAILYWLVFYYWIVKAALPGLLK